MIEVLFAESEAASMKVAKNKLVVQAVNGPTAVFLAGKKKPPQRPFCGWVEGTSEEVICLEFMMDVGDLREPMDSPYREELLREFKNSGGSCAEELDRLKNFLDSGEPVRIWYSDAPYSRCGLYSLCGLLRGYENELSVVKLPEYVVRDKSIVSYQSWNEVSAEEFAGFLSYEKPLSREEIRMYAMRWSDLVEENSFLRAVVNGRLLSVSEDFYDFLIWRWLRDEPVKEGRLIGDILGHSQLGVGDLWYARRIEYYIQRGEIQVVEDSENSYARRICRGKKGRLL